MVYLSNSYYKNQPFDFYAIEAKIIPDNQVIVFIKKFKSQIVTSNLTVKKTVTSLPIIYGLVALPIGISIKIYWNELQALLQSRSGVYCLIEASPSINRL